MSRRYVFPQPGETLVDVAARVFPGDERGPERLQSWNLHLLVRRPVGPGDELLPTDIVYVEQPPA